MLRSRSSMAARVSLVPMGVLILSVAGRSGDAPTPMPISKSDDPAEFTKAFVAQAIDRYDAEGRDAVLAYHGTMESVDGEWQFFVFDENDRVIVHPAVSANVGEDIKGPLGTDVNGYNFGEDMLTVTEEGKWVDYVYLNPTTDKEERKHTWVVKHDGLIFGSGWYER